MAVNVETLGTLERRLSMSVPVADVDRQVDDRLKKLARNVRMAGFRPGKVPLKLVVQQYGPQVRSEVIGDAVQKAFSDAVKEANLKVAGYPRIEKKDAAADAEAFEFSATFEVYPEVRIGDISGVRVERPQVTVDDAAVERTIEILRKQRVNYERVERAAQDGDRLTVDFEGRIGGETFPGGKASGFTFILGAKRTLPEFEAGARGLTAGESKSFELKFPDDYHGKDVAGKTASFALELKRVEAPRLPELDAEFARQLGVHDGNLEQMRAEVRTNVEREVKKRVEARLKEQALQALLDAAPMELPKALVQMETRQLIEAAAADLQAKGLRIEKLPFDPQAFEASARRRVALGLIVSALTEREDLRPKPADVRALIEAESQSYEHPAEVVKWFYMQPQRLSEMESLALEGNVVKWALSKAKVADKAVAFDELMGSGA
ncbi:MAG: trigger factor [Betaproteobacteria bacterium]|nr:trigger factor [Betaproteobacteria bacterium]